MRAAVILVVAAGFALGLAVGTTELVGRAAPPLAQPTSVIWANRVFATRHDLTVWLEARGSSYEAWSTRHPVAAQPFETPSFRVLDAPTGSAAAISSADQAGSATLTRTGAVTLAAILGVAVLLLFVRFVPVALAVAGVAHGSHTRFIHVPQLALRSPVPRRIRPGPVSRRIRPDRATEVSRGARRELRQRWSGLVTVARARSATGMYLIRRHRFIRRHFPSFAFYASSALLAFVVGASIAIFMK